MYGEIIVALNMLFNFTVLSFANKMQNTKIKTARLLFASFIGAILVVFLTISFWTIALIFLLMTFLAYGKLNPPWLRFSAMAMFGALFAGGFLTALRNQIQVGLPYEVVFLLALLAYIALSILKAKWVNVRMAKRLETLLMDSTLTLFDREIPLTIFIDSGNNCREPLSGHAVHFVSFKSIEEIIPKDMKEVLFKWDSQRLTNMVDIPKAHLKNVRVVKVFTVQGESWALGIKYDKWTLEGGIDLEEGYVVITKEDQRYPENAQAILNVSVLETIQNEGGFEGVQEI